MQTSNAKTIAARCSFIAAIISVVALISLHFASPEFAPAWRMVSEYANGKFEWMLFIFFCCWGISSFGAVYFLWHEVDAVAAKLGVLLLFISGTGEIMAAFFNVNHPQHGTAGTLGIPPFVIACLLISYHLRKKPGWIQEKGKLLLLSHLSWISLLLVAITMIVMITGFKNAGIAIGPGQKPPAALPQGVTGLVGYANRLLILVFISWLLFVSDRFLKIKTGEKTAGLRNAITA